MIFGFRFLDFFSFLRYIILGILSFSAVIK